MMVWDDSSHNHLRQVQAGGEFRRVERRRSVVVEGRAAPGSPASSAEHALVQLVALAQALTNDLGRFQQLVAAGGNRGDPS